MHVRGGADSSDVHAIRRGFPSAAVVLSVAVTLPEGASAVCDAAAQRPQSVTSARSAPASAPALCCISARGRGVTCTLEMGPSVLTAKVIMSAKVCVRVRVRVRLKGRVRAYEARLVEVLSLTR